MTNYYKYAEEYLKLWKKFDSDACDIFSDAEYGWSPEREDGARTALDKYDIARNFWKEFEEKRFEPLFEVIDAVQNLDDFTDSNGVINPVEAVVHVRRKLKNFYRRNVCVAASKILWFKFKSPIAICDRLTMTALGLKGNRRSYKNFYPLWKKRFEKDEAAISKACHELAEAHPKCKHRGKISKLWFRERTLDMCLLEEGAKIEAKEEARKKAKKKAKKKA